MMPRVAAALTIALVAPCAAAAPSAALAPTAPGAPGEVRLELVADGVEVLSNAAAPAGPRDVIYLLEQHTGRVRLVEDGAVAPEPVLDLGDRLIDDPWHEEGLVGLTLAPNQESAMFVSYIDQRDQLVVSRFDLIDGGRRADPASEAVLLEVPRTARIHHCGHLEFGPHDGLLYLCIGDMQWNTGEIRPVAQDPGSFHGKILRLDPSAAAPIARRESPLLPSAEATTGPAARPTIWLKGLRNPWRFSFDPVAGLIYLPDLGRTHFEELSILPLNQTAGNLGWPYAEAGECLTDCASYDDLIWPVLEYSHLDGRCAIIGGAAYRGMASPAWHGVYLFGDLCSGQIWALRGAQDEPEVRILLDSELMPVGLTRDHRGEILVVDGPGSVWRLHLPAEVGAGWRPAGELSTEMAMAARRVGFTRTRSLLDEAEAANTVMLESTRWRVTEPLVRLYELLGRPFD